MQRTAFSSTTYERSQFACDLAQYNEFCGYEEIEVTIQFPTRVRLSQNVLRNRQQSYDFFNDLLD
jgi:hypothetical protein